MYMGYLQVFSEYLPRWLSKHAKGWFGRMWYWFGKYSRLYICAFKAITKKLAICKRISTVPRRKHLGRLPDNSGGARGCSDDGPFAPFCALVPLTWHFSNPVLGTPGQLLTYIRLQVWNRCGQPHYVACREERHTLSMTCFCNKDISRLGFQLLS